LSLVNGEFRNERTLLGTNPKLDLDKYHIRGKAIPRSKFEGSQKDIMGHAKDNDGNDYVIISKESVRDVVGSQDSQLMDIRLNDAAQGIYKFGKGKDEIFLYPEAMRTAHHAVDTDIVTQLGRNLYAQQYKDVANDIAFRQFSILRDAGVIMSENKYNRLPKEARERYSRSRNGKTVKNPFDANFGRFYYDEKFSKYFEGSKGFDVGRKAMSRTFGEGLGPVMSTAAKTVLGATAALKGPILILRASSYVNSVVSNMMIYAINSGDALAAPQRLMQATKTYGQFKKLLENVVGDDMTKAGIKANVEALKKHELYEAFKSGIASTIRTQAYKTGTMGENMLYQQLRKLTGDERMADSFKYMLFDPNTKHGHAFGTIFDNTEIIPKIMMYMAKKDEAVANGLASKAAGNYASQHVLLAYPTYNNLGTFWNTIDQVSPFTKYAVNYPKMFWYAATMNPKKFAAMNAGFMGAVRASYGSEIDDNELFWYENNFADIGLGFKSTDSLNPYIVPTKGYKDSNSWWDAVVAPDFVPSAAKSLTDVEKIFLPYTVPND
jgi:hypothetical protein